MNESFTHLGITMPTGASASGATLNSSGVVVADGFTPFLYRYSPLGEYREAIPVVRAYKKISYDYTNDRYIAVGCGCNGLVYILNCRFEEVTQIDPGVSFGVIEDATPTCNCNIAITFTQSVGLFNSAGEYLQNIKPQNANVIYYNYLYFCDGEIYQYCKNGSKYVSFTKNGYGSTNASVPNTVMLKSLIGTDGGGIYGFVTYKYLYNYIFPIFENGVFSLNSLSDITSLINSVSSGKCLNNVNGFARD